MQADNCTNASLCGMIPDETVRSLIVAWITVIISTCSSLCAIITNTLVLSAIISKKPLQVTSNILLSCLITNDLIVALFCQPFLVIKQARIICLNRECHFEIAGLEKTVNLWIETTFSAVSLAILTIICAERYLAVLHPFKHQMHCNTKTLLQLVASVVALTIFGHVFLFFMSATEIFPIVFTIVMLEVLLCAIIVIVSNIKLFLTAKHHANQILAQGNSQRQRLEMKAAFTVSIIVGTFVLSILPIYSWLLYYAATGRLGRSPQLHPIIGTVVYFSATLDPLIYCWRQNDIKQAVRELFDKVRNKRSPNTIQV